MHKYHTLFLLISVGIIAAEEKVVEEQNANTDTILVWYLIPIRLKTNQPNLNVAVPPQLFSNPLELYLKELEKPQKENERIQMDVGNKNNNHEEKRNKCPKLSSALKNDTDRQSSKSVKKIDDKLSITDDLREEDNDEKDEDECLITSLMEAADHGEDTLVTNNQKPNSKRLSNRMFTVPSTSSDDAIPGMNVDDAALDTGTELENTKVESFTKNATDLNKTLTEYDEALERVLEEVLKNKDTESVVIYNEAAVIESDSSRLNSSNKNEEEKEDFDLSEEETEEDHETTEVTTETDEVETEQTTQRNEDHTEEYTTENEEPTVTTVVENEENEVSNKNDTSRNYDKSSELIKQYLIDLISTSALSKTELEQLTSMSNKPMCQCMHRLLRVMLSDFTQEELHSEETNTSVAPSEAFEELESTKYTSKKFEKFIVHEDLLKVYQFTIYS